MRPEPEWKSLDAPEVGSRWDQTNNGLTRTVRVMAIVEGYIVARLTGCTPFIIHMSDWHHQHRAKDIPQRFRRGTHK